MNMILLHPVSKNNLKCPEYSHKNKPIQFSIDHTHPLSLKKKTFPTKSIIEK